MTGLARRAWTPIAAALLAAGCGLDLSDAHRCETAAHCAGGRTCVDNRCVVPAAPEAELEPHDDPMEAGLAQSRSTAGTRSEPDGGAPAGRGEDDTREQDPGFDMSLEGGVSAPFEVGDSGMHADPRDAGTHEVTGDDADGGDEDAGGDDTGGDDAGAPADVLCSEQQAVLPGVVLWLDAARNVTADAEQRVQQWGDSSSVGHVAKADRDAEDWPTLVSHEGHPAIRFGLTADLRPRRMLVPDEPNLRLGYDGFAVIAVVRHHTSTDAAAAPNAVGLIYGKVCACDNYAGAALFANDDYDRLSGLEDTSIRSNFLFQTRYGTGSARSVASGFNDDRVHVVVARRISSAYRLRVDVDGQLHSLAFTDLYDVSATGYPASIGANSSAEEQSLDGDIFELVVIRAAPPTVTAVSDCLLAKYRP